MKKRKMNVFLKFLIFIVVFVLIVFIILKILLPDLFGPRDLGVSVTNKSYNLSLKKLKIEKIIEDKTGSYNDYIYKYGKVNEVENKFNSEEITSFIKYKENDWYDVKNVQIKISNEGLIEMSASVNVNAVLKATDFVPEKYKNKDNIPVSFIIPDIANIYLQFSGSIKDNKIETLKIIKAEVMSVDVNDYIIGYKATPLIAGELNNQLKYLNKLSGFYVSYATFKNSNMYFKGLIPSYIKSERK